MLNNNLVTKFPRGQARVVALEKGDGGEEKRAQRTSGKTFGAAQDHFDCAFHQKCAQRLRWKTRKKMDCDIKSCECKYMVSLEVERARPMFGLHQITLGVDIRTSRSLRHRATLSKSSGGSSIYRPTQTACSGLPFASLILTLTISLLCAGSQLAHPLGSHVRGAPSVWVVG